MDWSERAAAMAQAAREDRDWHAALARQLLRPGDRVVVDVGCGAGGMTAAFAAALGPEGRVLAVDASAPLLAVVAEQVREVSPTGGGAPVELVEADLHAGVEPVRAALPKPADLVWAARSVHHLGDQQRAVDELTTLLAPGGRLALAEGGLKPRCLPWDVGVGEPGLELRLLAANDRYLARMRAELPGHRTMPYGWTEALRRAGLVDVTTRNFLYERPVPLSDRDRGRVVEHLTDWVGRLRPTGLLSEADVAAWDRLLEPDDAAWLGHRTDLELLRVDSVHVGTRPA